MRIKQYSDLTNNNSLIQDFKVDTTELLNQSQKQDEYIKQVVNSQYETLKINDNKLITDEEFFSSQFNNGVKKDVNQKFSKLKLLQNSTIPIT